MFLKDNKGTILIFTLMIFSIISIITMMCIGLNYSNNTLFKLEYKRIILKENSESGLEITSSNILKEVENAALTTNSEEEFKDYFLGNNFINKIKDISHSQLKNVSINIPNQPVYENGVVKFKITSTSTENKYAIQMQASINIKNPYIDIVDIDKSKYNNQPLNIEEVKANIDYNNILIIYDYKEI